MDRLPQASADPARPAPPPAGRFALALLILLPALSLAQLPDPNKLFPDQPPEEPEPTRLDSATAPILASDTLTAYQLAMLERPMWPWQLDLRTRASISQGSYTANWDGSEKGSFVWTAHLEGRVRKRFGPRVATRTTLYMAYGQTHTQENDTRRWKRPTRTNDRIDAESLARLTLDALLDPFVSGRFQSSFLDSRVRGEDVYINPIQLNESFGASRAFWPDVPTREVLLRAGVTLRHNLDRNAVVDTATGRRGTHWTHDGGLEMVADIKASLLEGKVNYTGRLALYQALVTSTPDDERSGAWRTLDFDWENRFSASITDVLQVSLLIWWRYDKEISRAGRVKQTLGLDLAYTLL